MKQRIGEIKKLTNIKENLGLTYRKTLDLMICEYPILKKENKILKQKIRFMGTKK